MLSICTCFISDTVHVHTQHHSVADAMYTQAHIHFIPDIVHIYMHALSQVLRTYAPSQILYIHAHCMYTCVHTQLFCPICTHAPSQMLYTCAHTCTLSQMLYTHIHAPSEIQYMYPCTNAPHPRCYAHIHALSQILDTCMYAITVLGIMYICFIPDTTHTHMLYPRCYAHAHTCKLCPRCYADTHAHTLHP